MDFYGLSTNTSCRLNKQCQFAYNWLPLVLGGVLVESISVFFLVFVLVVPVRRFKNLPVNTEASQPILLFLLQSLKLQSPLLFLWVRH